MRTDYNTIPSRGRSVIAEENLREYCRAMYEKEGYTCVYNAETEVGSDNKTSNDLYTLLQNRGVDLFLSEPGNGGHMMLVDEKAASSRRNAYDKLGTFAFEVTSDNNYLRRGWLYTPYTVTTHYALVYPDMVDQDVSTLNKMETIVVSKEKMFAKMFEIFRGAGIGTMDEVLRYFDEHAHWCRDNCQRCDVTDGIRMTKSHKFREKPLNIIVDRKILRENSDAWFHCTDTKALMGRRAA